MYGRFGTGRSQNAQIEKKFWDTALVLGASVGIASVSQVTGALNRGLAQGTNANQRIGQRIVIKSIQVKGTVTLPAGGTDTDLWDCWLIQDSQANGAGAAIADFFQAGGNLRDQLREMANGQRFKVLKHWAIDLNADAGVAAAFGGDIQHFECFLKCNIPIVYNGAAGGIAEIRSNNLLMIYGSSAGVATAAGNARIRFTDR